MTPEEHERRNKRLLGPSQEALRDMEVARATIGPRSECPHCNPGAEENDSVGKDK